MSAGHIATFVLPLEAFDNGLTLFLVFFDACDPVLVFCGLHMFLNSAFLDCKGFVTGFAPQLATDTHEMLTRIFLDSVIGRGFAHRILRST